MKKKMVRVCGELLEIPIVFQTKICSCFTYSSGVPYVTVSHTNQIGSTINSQSNFLL